MKLKCIFLSVFLFANNLISQDYKDCSNPLVLCGESPFLIVPSAGIGVEEDVSNTCLLVEYYSTWISVDIITAGTLTFVLQPEKDSTDTDFVVFKDIGEACENKELVRCMGSGLTINSSDSTQYMRCLGATGLREGEIDIEERGGCDPDDNNFLAPLDCMVGDHFYILINVPYGNIEELKLEFGGTAEINCISTKIFEDDLVDATIKIYPNPTDDILFYEIPSAYFGGLISISNLEGQVLYHDKNINSNNGKIILDREIPGLYFMTITQKGNVINIPLILH